MKKPIRVCSWGATAGERERERWGEREGDGEGEGVERKRGRESNGVPPLNLPYFLPPSVSGLDDGA